MLVLEVMVGDIMVVIEIVIEGEAGRSRPCRFWGVVDGGGLVYGSPRKEKMIWICFGERILRGRE